MTTFLSRCNCVLFTDLHTYHQHRILLMLQHIEDNENVETPRKLILSTNLSEFQVHKLAKNNYFYCRPIFHCSTTIHFLYTNEDQDVYVTNSPYFLLERRYNCGFTVNLFLPKILIIVYCMNCFTSVKISIMSPWSKRLFFNQITCKQTLW